MILPDELNDDLWYILGIPCFCCIHEAKLFRASGYAVPEKAEAEQAFLIHWLLTIYAEHGTNWREVAGQKMRAMIAAVKASTQKETGPQ